MDLNLDPSVMVCSLCTVQGLPAAHAQIADWFTLEFGENWPYPLTDSMDVAARTHDATDQTHWFCLTELSSNYVSRVIEYAADKPTTYIMEVEHYTSFLSKHNILIMDSNKNARYLQMEQVYIAGQQARRENRKYQEYRRLRDTLKRRGY